MFETDLRDEHYLPFENSGVVSEWQLQLPANPGKDGPPSWPNSTSIRFWRAWRHLTGGKVSSSVAMIGIV